MLRNIVLNLVHCREVLVLLHNNNVVQKLSWETVSSFEDDESICVGLVLMLLLSYVQLTGRGVTPPCVGAVGQLAVVLLGEERQAFRHVKISQNHRITECSGLERVPLWVI